MGGAGFLADDTGGLAAALGRIGTIDRRVCRRDAERRFSAARMVADHVRVYERVIAERWDRVYGAQRRRREQHLQRSGAPHPGS